MKIQVQCHMTSEKDAYKCLKKYVFKKSYKLYTPVLRGFPDFIVLELQDNFKDVLEAGFYEVKYKKGKLTPYQTKFCLELSQAFPVYLVRASEDCLEFQRLQPK